MEPSSLAAKAFIGIGQIRPLGAPPPAAESSGGCGTTGGSGKASCGSSGGPDDMPPEIWEKVKNHPCYSEEAHHHYARMHVAVAPACNIQCHYCNRKYDCSNESRPRVVSQKLTPDQAVKKVLAQGLRTPDIHSPGTTKVGTREMGEAVVKALA